MAHAGRHTHHVLASRQAAPHHHQRFRTPSRRETRVRNPAESTGKPRPDAQSHPLTQKTARRRLASGITGQKTTERTPRRTRVRRHFRPEASNPGNFNTPVGCVWIPILQCRWGCFFSDSSTSSSASTVVCGGRKRKGLRTHPLFPATTNHCRRETWLGISNGGKQARLCPVRMETCA